MQCKTLKQAVSDSRNKLGSSSTGIKQRFGQNVNRTQLSFDKENKTPSSVFMARHEAATFCLKSRDMAVSPVLVHGVRAVPEKCSVLREVAIEKHHEIIMPFLSDLVFNIEDAYDVVRSEIRRASPALQIMHDTSKDLVKASKTTVGSVGGTLPRYVEKLQQKVVRAYRSRQQPEEEEEKKHEFDPAFVHACHECDNCKAFPIEGYRWRAVRPRRFGETMDGAEANIDFKKELTLPDTSKRNFVEMDYDLCHMCYMTWRALGCSTLDLPRGAKFYSAQLEDDRLAHLVRHNLPVPAKSPVKESEEVKKVEEEQVVFSQEEDNSKPEEEKSSEDDCDWTKTETSNDNEVQSLPSDMSVAASEDIISIDTTSDDEKSSSESDESWNKMEKSSSSSSSSSQKDEVLSLSDNEVVVETDEATEITSNKGVVDTTPEVISEDEMIVVVESKEETEVKNDVVVAAEDDEGCSSGEESEWSLLSEKSNSSKKANTPSSTPPQTISSGEDFYRWFMS